MQTLNQRTTDGQKAGAFAALYLAAAYLIAMPFFLLVIDSPSVTTAAQKVALLVDHNWSMHAMYLVTYVVFGMVLSVLALTLHQRLKDAAPVVMRVATATGLLWSFVLVASGLVFNAGMAATVNLSSTDPTGAAALWQAVEPVAMGLGGSGGELLGGVWVLLVSVAALRVRAQRRALGWLGLLVGVAGLISVVPPLADAGKVFGLLQIVWFVWLGVTMLRRREHPAPALALNAEPA